MKDLKERIKKKYGTVSKFCRLSGIEIAKMNSYLFRIKRDPQNKRLKPFTEYINYMIKRTPSGLEGTEITPQERDLLKKYIDNHFMGSYSDFARQFDFDISNVRQVAVGIRKRQTEVTRKILNVIK